jgi:hypothetical protein
VPPRPHGCSHRCCRAGAGACSILFVAFSRAYPSATNVPPTLRSKHRGSSEWPLHTDGTLKDRRRKVADPVSAAHGAVRFLPHECQAGQRQRTPSSSCRSDWCTEGPVEAGLADRWLASPRTEPMFRDEDQRHAMEHELGEAKSRAGGIIDGSPRFLCTRAARSAPVVAQPR